jgi:hypothetical protein
LADDLDEQGEGNQARRTSTPNEWRNPERYRQIGRRISFGVKVYGRQVSFTGTVDGNKMSGTTKEGAPWLAAHQ